MSYSGKENYSLPTVNYTDVNMMHHVQYYDAHNATGALSMITDPNVIPGDVQLIDASFDIAFTPDEHVSLKDKVQSLAVGIFFLITTSTKAVVSGNAP